MARLERFTADMIGSRPDPEQRQILRRYATWHLLRRLRSRNHGRPVTTEQQARHATTGAEDPSPWLFPGGQPGRPVSSGHLGQRLKDLGIHPGQARSTALFQLASELPVALLARMLGIHIDAATTWQRVSAGDWMAYAADISRRNQR